jgi:hypothetical protein
MHCHSIAASFGARARSRALIGLLALGVFNTLSAWESAWVKTVNGRLTYPADAEGNSIPDFSNAGYDGGNSPIPTVTRKVGEVNPSMSVAQINAAIATAGASTSATNRGYVLFKTGVYNVDTPIVVNMPGIVLRGENAATTILRATTAFVPGFPNPDDGKGKMVVLIVDGKTPDRYQWSQAVSGTRSLITTPKVLVGSRSFQVENAGLFLEGQEIIIEHPQTDAWVAAVDTGDDSGNRYWPEGPDGKSPKSPGSIRYHRYIKSVNSVTNTITVDAPVFNHLDARFFPGTDPLKKRAVYRPSRSITVREVGVENLTVEGFNADPTPSTEATDEEEKTSTQDAINFRGVENCWIKGVTVSKFVRGGIWFSDGATRSTAIACTALNPAGDEDGGNWYHFLAERAQLILFEGCRAVKARHAFIANGGTVDSGIVALECTVENPRGSSEMHRYWGQGMLFDSCKAINVAAGKDVIQFYNRGHSGMPDGQKISSYDNTGHGWSAVHSVIWRLDGGNGRFSVQKPVTGQNYAIGNVNAVLRTSFSNPGPRGIVERTGEAGLSPVSLYRAQLADRRLDDPSFTLAVTPTTRTVAAGGSVTYTATVTPQNGFNGAVNLSVSNLPAGATDGSWPTTITGGGSSTLTVTTATTTPASNSTLTITAVSGSITRTQTVALTVQAAAAVATPTFTPAAGTYTTAQNVQISTTTSGAQIFYTTDGTDPRTSGTRQTYTGAIAVATTTTLNAYATSSGLTDSAVATAAYTINTGGGGGDRTITMTDGFVNIALPAAQTGVFELVFEAAPAATDTTIGLCNNAQTAYAGLAAVVRFSITNVIEALNAGAYAATSSVPYTLGTRYRIRFVVDMGTRTYSVYTRPAAGGAESTVASDFAFRTGQATITTINTLNVKCNVGNLTLSLATIPTSITPPAWANNPTVTFTGTNFVAGVATTPSGPNLTVAFNATPAVLGNMSPVDKLPLTGSGGWAVKLRSNGDLWFRIGSEASTARTDMIVAGVYAANTPVHIACTFTGGTARVYVNGVERGVLTGITHVVSNTTTTLRLGIPSVSAVADEYVGALSRVKTYNGALSAAQIRLLAD